MKTLREVKITYCALFRIENNEGHEFKVCGSSGVKSSNKMEVDILM